MNNRIGMLALGGLLLLATVCMSQRRTIDAQALELKKVARTSCGFELEQKPSGVKVIETPMTQVPPVVEEF